MIAERPILPEPGPTLLEHGCRFTVWAPAAATVELHIVEPHERLCPMRALPLGFHQADVAGAGPGTRYTFILDGRVERPDPASRLQPLGVHGPSEVPPAAFAWSDAAWQPPGADDLVLYELHVGTFTAEATFDAAARELPALRALGVRAVELMPVCAFPGARNWGYDGVYPYAVHHDYGGPLGLKRFVDSAHAAGLAVHLDVVYNHLGPEGNYLADFGPYFTSRYATPWGGALNFDGADSDAVRDFFIRSAIRWIVEFHIDGLRLDAVHAIIDVSPRPFVQELTQRVRAAARAHGRSAFIAGESDLGDPRVIMRPEHGGLGCDAQWLDDFHHALHVLVTGESRGYYADFGGVEQLAKAYRGGYVYTGQYSRYRRRSHGARPTGSRPADFIAFAQNHDQIGNRAAGDRLTATLDAARLRLVAAAVLLAPFIPLLFMGEEYGEVAPFPYFVSHGDADLIAAVRHGRRAEFQGFDGPDEPPDPQDTATFESARLDRGRAGRPGHRELRDLYRELLALRRELGLSAGPFPRVDCEPATGWIRLHRPGERVRSPGADPAQRRPAPDSTPPATVAILQFGAERASVPLPPGAWRCRLDTADPRWGGAGAPAAATRGTTAAVDVEPFSAVLLSNDA